MKEALFYRETKGQKLQCLLCPHFCLIAEGNAGKCRVRKNLGGKLFSLIYGRITSSNLDPIEKKPLYQFYPGSNILSLGTLGCNLACQFCQNWNISQLPEKPGDGAKIEAFTYEITAREVVETAVKLKARKNIGVAYTYNEPLMWYEFVLECAQKIKAAGLFNVLVTNGFINEEPLKQLLPYINAANVDLKSIKNEFYQKYCGGKPAPVLNSLKLFKNKVHLEVTNLIIPTLNDSREDLEALTSWIADNLGRDTPIHFSRYHPEYQLEIPATPPETLELAHQIAEKKLDYVYLGNLPFNPWDNTYCPQCKKPVLIRQALCLKDSRLDSNKLCSYCSAPLKITGEVL